MRELQASRIDERTEQQDAEMHTSKLTCMKGLSILHTPQTASKARSCNPIEMQGDQLELQTGLAQVCIGQSTRITRRAKASAYSINRPIEHISS